jgi:hypothetical protein
MCYIIIEKLLYNSQIFKIKKTLVPGSNQDIFPSHMRDRNGRTFIVFV